MGRTRGGDGERGTLSNTTSGVAEHKTEGSASGLVDGPCEGCAVLPTKILEGRGTGLSTGEQAAH